MDKKSLSERDICTKFITPALRAVGWDEMLQIREEVSFTKGRITVRGKMVSRGKAKRADYILYIKPNIPLALIEAKDNKHAVGDGMQQALGYAETLNIPYVFASNGDGFVFHDRTGVSAEKESNIALDTFPSPTDLWARYSAWKGLTPAAEEVVLQDYYDDGSDKAPRYYQVNAVNAAIEAIAKGKDRILLVMATGTGKTYTAFQIIWRLWKAGRRKRILFLADRNILIDQTMVNDFRPFGPAMAKLSSKAKTIERADGAAVDLTLALDHRRRIDTAYEIYLGLYQAITGPEDRQKLFREFSPGFFDLIVIDECHRGSAADDAAWREILEHFSAATQIGLTATPKETEYVSNTAYFGEPVFTYSLRQGISDGFLAPYKVIKVHIDRDVEGYPNRDEYVDKGVAWINTGHIEPGGSLSLASMNFITRAKFDVLGGGKIRSGDLIYCLRGATFGKTAFVEPFTEGAIASSLMIVRPSPIVDRRFTYLYLISPLGRSQLMRFDNGTAQPNLSSGNVKKYLLPIPPLAEQHRIVTKVDELMIQPYKQLGPRVPIAEVGLYLADN